MYAVPREQLVRPGHRRSLMRRALVNIVPHELLNRKRKAYVARSTLAAISADWNRYSNLTQYMASGSLRMVDPKAFLDALQKARHGQEVSAVTVIRTLGIEFWLTNLSHRRILFGNEKDVQDLRDGLAPTPISAEKN
jgi:asparagine synthase (glutamine-hydrolysing)